jgi:hypothetical protein
VIVLRHEIESTPVRDPRDQVHKAYLLSRAEVLTHDLRRGGEMLISAYYNDLPATARERLRIALLDAFREGNDIPEDLAETAELSGLRPFHWPLEVPEVFLDRRDGFEAFVGNPPFMGGKRIRDILGDQYRTILTLM